MNTFNFRKNFDEFSRRQTKMRHEKYSKRSRNFNHASFVLSIKYPILIQFLKVYYI